MSTESLVRRMEHIREELDENGDLSDIERKELVYEYRLLNAELMRGAPPQSGNANG